MVLTWEQTVRLLPIPAPMRTESLRTRKHPKVWEAGRFCHWISSPIWPSYFSSQSLCKARLRYLPLGLSEETDWDRGSVCRRVLGECPRGPHVEGRAGMEAGRARGWIGDNQSQGQFHRELNGWPLRVAPPWVKGPDLCAPPTILNEPAAGHWLPPGEGVTLSKETDSNTCSSSHQLRRTRASNWTATTGVEGD